MKIVVFALAILIQEVAISQRASCSDIHGDEFCSSQSFSFFDSIEVFIVLTILSISLYKFKELRNSVFSLLAMVVGLGMISNILGTTAGIIAALISMAIIYKKSNKEKIIKDDFESPKEISELNSKLNTLQSKENKNLQNERNLFSEKFGYQAAQKAELKVQPINARWYITNQGIGDKLNSRFIPIRFIKKESLPKSGYRINDRFLESNFSKFIDISEFLADTEVSQTTQKGDLFKSSCPNCGEETETKAEKIIFPFLDWEQNVKGLAITCPTCSQKWYEGFNYDS
ncbi:hypothetical protein G6722_02135 [Polynucleobacter paneuropaeus]|nr:hypothetical protein [Polynucleobacter paneuropaeus]